MKKKSDECKNVNFKNDMTEFGTSVKVNHRADLIWEKKSSRVDSRSDVTSCAH